MTDIKLIDDNFLHVSHPMCKALVSLQGAQLIHWQPTGEDEVLWSSKLSNFKTGKAFRGGIPICWPWFGKNTHPSHGFARLMKWKLKESTSNADHVLLTFTLENTSETFKLFPHEFSLSLKMILGATCKVTLSIDSTKETTGALHSYFATDNILNEKIVGLGKYYTDATDKKKEKISNTPYLTVDKEIDYIYTNAENITLVSNNNRSVKITHYNQSDVVVWNPWSQKEKYIGDMYLDDHKTMICIETARINKKINKSDFISVEISVKGKK